MESNLAMECIAKKEEEEEMEYKTEMVDCGDEETVVKADPSLIKTEVDPLTGCWHC